MIKLTIPGRPISKSNFKLHNIHGQAWMPAKGKHSKYLAYENMIAGYINQQYQGEQIEEDLITVLKLYFPDKRIIKNDKQLKPVLLFNYIDKEEPRVEIFLYPVSKYDVSYTITEK